MSAKANAKAIRPNVLWGNSVPGTELLVEPIDRDDEGSGDVVILRLVANGIERRVIRKPVGRVKNLGWVVTLPVTRKTGVVLFVPRSRLAHRLVRLRHGTYSQRVKATRLKHLVTYARS
jgi:hypothetical protein